MKFKNAMKKSNTIIYILENIQFLLDSGMPLTSCLDVLSKRTNNQKVLEIKNKILEGKTFQEAITAVFNSKIPHMMNMFIQIGEKCGNLGQMILRAIDTDKQIKKINGSLIGALSYPAFICFVAIVMMLLTMIGIVPKLLPMFRDLHVELPIYTKFFIFVSNFLVNFGMYILMGLTSVAVLFSYLFRKYERLRIEVENVILNMWGIRSLYVRYHTSIIALCVSEYLRAGFTLHDAIKMVGNSAYSYAYKNACNQVSIDLQNGKSIHESVALHEKIMPEWSYILGLASETGHLSHQFERFYLENITYLEKVNVQIKRWSEPALMLFIGGIIAVFAVSIISPIYSVVQNVRI